MKQADPKDSPQERLVHYLEMAAKAHEAARGTYAEVRIRNLYVWVAKSWEMLAIDEIDRLRAAARSARSEGPRRGRRVPRAAPRAGEHSHTR
jgi:hypothetical protein